VASFIYLFIYFAASSPYTAIRPNLAQHRSSPTSRFRAKAAGATVSQFRPATPCPSNHCHLSVCAASPSYPSAAPSVLLLPSVVPLLKPTKPKVIMAHLLVTASPPSTTRLPDLLPYKKVPQPCLSSSAPWFLPFAHQASSPLTPSAAATIRHRYPESAALPPNFACGKDQCAPSYSPCHHSELLRPEPTISPNSDEAKPPLHQRSTLDHHRRLVHVTHGLSSYVFH
jgi:hypothetical protein